MDNMRWILLLVGAVIVLGIYIADRMQAWRKSRPARRRAGRRAAPLKQDLEPGLERMEDTGSDANVDAELEQLGQLLAEDAASVRQSPVVEVRAAKPDPVPVPFDKVFSLFVIAPAGVPFRGPMLLGALQAAGLEYGDMQIFHRSEVINGQVKHLFSVANIREPGILDPAAMENFTTEGVALFMQVPGAVDAVHAFDVMLEAARILADKLDATVCDATRSVMTNQTTSHMRDEVISCQLQQRVASTAS
jgi:cell division protein ZipA